MARRPKISDLIREFEAAGKTVRAARLNLNGSVELLTEAPQGAFNDGEGELWDLAGEKALPRA